MQYINNTLLKNEKVILINRPHWIVFFTPVLIFIFAALFYYYFADKLRTHLVIYGLTVIGWALVFAFVCGVYAFLSACVTFYFSEYGITNKRVLMKTGMIQRNSLELFLDKVEAIHVNQSVLARILNYGTLVVIGTGGSRDFFRYVPQPLRFRKVIQEQIDHFTHEGH